MKKDLSHIPAKKLKELNLLQLLIKEHFKPEMIILFGSYARGDYVNKPYEYESDFDILVALEKKDKSITFGIEHRIRELITKKYKLQFSINFQVESVAELKQEIINHNYLFVDIRNDGIVLYNPKSIELPEVKIPEPEYRFSKAKKDFGYWLKSANATQSTFGNNVEREEKCKDEKCKDEQTRQIALNHSAYYLHHSTESLIAALLLVYTCYKPKTHKLTKLLELTESIDPRVPKAFPRITEKDKHLFDLLERAYVDARYDMNYKITKEELDEIAQWVSNFKPLVKELCEKKINELEKAAANS